MNVTPDSTINQAVAQSQRLKTQETAQTVEVALLKKAIEVEGKAAMQLLDATIEGINGHIDTYG